MTDLRYKPRTILAWVREFRKLDGYLKRDGRGLHERGWIMSEEDLVLKLMKWLKNLKRVSVKKVREYINNVLLAREEVSRWALLFVTIRADVWCPTYVPGSNHGVKPLFNSPPGGATAPQLILDEYKHTHVHLFSERARLAPPWLLTSSHVNTASVYYLLDLSSFSLLSTLFCTFVFSFSLV